MSAAIQSTVVPTKASLVRNAQKSSQPGVAARQMMSPKPFLGSTGVALPLRATRARSQVARRSVVVKAEEGGSPFDSLIAKTTEKFEAAENKPVVVGYIVASVVGLYVIESLLHLPLLNVLIGLPVEILGVCTAGVLTYKYLKEGGDPAEDLEGTLDMVTKELPGLKKD